MGLPGVPELKLSLKSVVALKGSCGTAFIVPGKPVIIASKTIAKSTHTILAMSILGIVLVVLPKITLIR